MIYANRLHHEGVKKILLIIMDGLGGRPSGLLGGRTSLQAAYRPNMNFLVRNGIGGLMYPVSQGIRAGSDTSHLSILGYDPRVVYTGRGPFEAMGLGMDVSKGDVAFRANFATRADSGFISDRRAGRIQESTDELCRAISLNVGGVTFEVKPGVEHRAALVMHGDHLSSRVSDSDPHEAGKPPLDITATVDSAKRTANVLNQYLERIRKILDDHPFNRDRVSNGKLPANELLIRGAGMAPDLQDFQSKYGLRAACVAGIPMISGICKLMGMDIIHAKGVTGRLDSDYESKISSAVKSLDNHDFVIVNLKGPDIAGHDGNPLAKRDVIERADSAYRQLVSLGHRVVISITGDHSTPAEYGDHSGDPVPILIYTENGRKDCAKRFDEVSCSRGSLRILSGDLMQYLLSVSDITEKYGA